MTDKPNLTRVWAKTAPGGNVVDPDTVTAGKFAAGWQAEVPPFEYFNFIQKQVTEGLAHINEQGIAIWDTVTVYPVAALVKGSDGNIYKCSVSQSGNNPVADPGTNWLLIDLDSIGTGEVTPNDESIVRKAITGERFEWSKLSTDTLNEVKRTTTDGSNIPIWQPDGTGFYDHCWIRDMSMMMHWNSSYFSPNEIKDAFNWYLSYSNTSSDYQVPDHINVDGTIFWTPGSSNTWGDRAPIDGNTYLLQLCWLHYKLTGSASLFTDNKQEVINLLEVGVPLNSNGVVEVPNDSSWYVCFGFQDTARISGVTAFGNMLVFEAYNRLSEMCYKVEDRGNAKLFKEKADTIKTYINSNLFKSSIITSTLGVRRFVGYYEAGSNVCKQPDAWASCFAITCGLAEEQQSKPISAYISSNLEEEISFVGDLLKQYSTDLFSYGGMRHVALPDQFLPTQMWEAYFSEPIYGDYQNGGYWATPMAWAVDALLIENPELASKMISYLQSEFTRQEFSLTGVLPAEWWTVNLSGVGSPKYGTSAAVLMFINGYDLPQTFLQNETLSPTGQNLTSTPSKYLMGELVRNELGYTSISNDNFTAPCWDMYTVEVGAVLKDGADTVNAYVSLFLNNNEIIRIAGSNFTNGSCFLFGSVALNLKRGDVLDVRLVSLGVGVSVDNSGPSSKSNHVRITRG